jgi:hypothetical protein
MQVSTIIRSGSLHLRHNDRIQTQGEFRLCNLGKAQIKLRNNSNPSFLLTNIFKPQWTRSLSTPIPHSRPPPTIMCDVPFIPFFPICFQCGTDQNPCHCKVVGPTLGKLGCLSTSRVGIGCTNVSLIRVLLYDCRRCME